MNKTVFFLIMSLLCIDADAQQALSLDGGWNFWIPTDSATAALPAYAKSPVQVTVPHTYNLMDGLENYAGRAFYNRELPLTEDMKGKNLWIHFDGVYHDAIVFINGVKAGEHLYAGYTPFAVDITPYIVWGGKNIVTVQCDNPFSSNNLPWKRKFDWNNDGGIYRSVSLRITGHYTLRYVHVTPRINLSDSTATAKFTVRFRSSAPFKADFSIRITENCSGRIVFDGRKILQQKKDSTFICEVSCGKVQLWHFDNPHLYTFDVKIWHKNTVSDSERERFGFRTFTIKGHNFCLNGEPVRLPGIEDMPGSNPAYGAAESRSYMEKSVRMMKDLNCTFSRFHWAQDDYRLQLMDSLGILVQEELSWWQGPSRQLTPELQQTARRQLDELIEAHYNHPCIWGWGVSNEVSDNQAEVLHLANHIRSMDSTRIIDAVSNSLYTQLSNDPSLSLDLPTWNEYVGTWHAKDRSQLAGFFLDVEKALDGRPVLIAEAGLCEPAFTGGDARRVDEMIYHITEWKRHPFVCGYIYFCLEDYRTQMGEEGRGRHRIRRHGVCTKELQPKSSYHILRQLMCPIEVILLKPANAKVNKGSIANLYETDDANRAAEVTLQVKNDIPTYTLRNYRIEYERTDGTTVSIPLLTLIPGRKYTLMLTDINASFSFYVKRSDGSIVLQY